jgi:hypothetical protein
MFFEYWKKETKILTYLIMDWFFLLAYKKIPSITSLIDSIPYNNPRWRHLAEKMNDPFNERIFAEICSDTRACSH